MMGKSKKRRATRRDKPSERERKTINWLVADTPMEARWFDAGDRIDARQMARNAENQDVE
jgi:hypothetical protein